jgi:hypothetical protein
MEETKKGVIKAFYIDESKIRLISFEIEGRNVSMSLILLSLWSYSVDSSLFL